MRFSNWLEKNDLLLFARVFKSYCAIFALGSIVGAVNELALVEARLGGWLIDEGVTAIDGGPA